MSPLNRLARLTTLETPMPRIAANLSMRFTEVPLLDRFKRAARAGFSSHPEMASAAAG